MATMPCRLRLSVRQWLFYGFIHLCAIRFVCFPFVTILMWLIVNIINSCVLWSIARFEFRAWGVPNVEVFFWGLFLKIDILLILNTSNPMRDAFQRLSCKKWWSYWRLVPTVYLNGNSIRMCFVKNV